MDNKSEEYTHDLISDEISKVIDKFGDNKKNEVLLAILNALINHMNKMKIKNNVVKEIFHFTYETYETIHVLQKKMEQFFNKIETDEEYKD